MLAGRDVSGQEKYRDLGKEGDGQQAETECKFVRENVPPPPHHQLSPPLLQHGRPHHLPRPLPTV